MATLNIRRKLGLRPIDNGKAGTSPRIEEFRAAASAITKNSMVALNTAGLVTMIAAGSGSSLLLGVAANHVAAGVAGDSRVVQVYTDPDQRYLIGADDASLTRLTDYLGRCFALTTINSVNSTTLESKGELDASTGTSVATNTVCMKCVGAYGGVDNYVAVIAGANSGSFSAFIVQAVGSKHIYSKAGGV